MSVRRALLLVAGLVVPLVAVPAAPAYARPVAMADRVSIYTGATYTVAPLANDSTTLLSMGELSLCGLLNQSPQRLFVQQIGDQVEVEVDRRATGTVSFTYEACQGGQRDSATVTLRLTRLTDVKGAAKSTPRGKVTFTNPNDVDVRVRFGSATNGTADGMRALAARRTIIVGTTRRSIYWVAFLLDGDVLVPAGDGTITDIPQPRR